MSFQDNILDISRLTLSGDFEKQVGQLLPQVRLTRSQVVHLQNLILDVQATLANYWPGCKVFAFGSIVTGLGITNSDVDCYVRLPHWVQLHSKLVYKAKNYLQEQPDLFSNLSAIPFAKVPIVKCYHRPTRRNCDINFTSQAGVENSQLLAHLLHLDPRALPLAILIKYWSKVHKLTGTMLMPNYALTLLVIFYLQHSGILPNVHSLQLTVPPRIIENWNTAFDTDIVPFHPQGSLELYQLLGGFFNYYSNFDYKNLVISTYLGAALDKGMFLHSETIPSHLNLLQHNLSVGVCKNLRLDTPMCIQDPFDHSRNCAVAVHPKLFDVVMKYFRRSAQLFHEAGNHKFLRAILTIPQTRQDDIAIKNSQDRVNRFAPHKVMKGNKVQRKINKDFKKNAFILYDQIRKRR